MRIEKIIIEEIGPFDKSFNAITGKNGSGKSNILDAIMFVLGATKAGQLRVKDFSGLVYKEGLSGVTRASVSIIFNNTEKETSPAGYEDRERFTVTRSVKHGDGSSKYLIDGTQTTLAKVHSLFHSVQLNIDNPTFLVQQGQITKVVNMKPPEVLSMLEEATGVRLFEDQKTKALKTLALKQVKVDELDKVLREEITPTLEKRRAESEQYQRWVRNTQELDRKRRFVVAHTYYTQQQLLEKAKETEERLGAEVNELEKSTKGYNTQLEEVKEELRIWTNKRKEESGKDMQELESKENTVSKELVQCESEMQYQTKTLKEELALIATLTQNLKDVEESITTKEQAQSTASSDFEVLTQELQHLQQQVVSLGQRMEAAEAGVATGAGEASGSLTDQLMETKQAQSKAKTLLKQLDMKIKANTKELQDKESKVKQAGAQVEEVNQKTKKLMKEKSDIQSRLDALKFDPKEKESLLEERNSLVQKIKSLSAQIEALAPRCQGGFDYRFQSPNSNFDRSKVHGRVGKLISVRDPEACTALEVVAGGKIRNVVVDSESVGRELLKCNTQQRTTFIPLDKIKSNPQTEKAKMAKELVGEENANLATHLVANSAAVQPAVDYVFGRSIVCKENSHAKAIAFNKDKRMVAHCVTYDGDVYDPSGTLTGGSKGKMGESLKHMNELRAMEKEREIAMRRVKEIDGHLTKLQSVSAKFEEIHRELQLKEHEYGLLQEKMKNSASHQLIMRIEELKAEIDRDEAAVKKTATEEQEAGKKVSELENLIKDFAKTKDSQIKEMKKEIQSNKKKQKDIKSKLAQARESKDTTIAELSALKEEKVNIESQLEVSTKMATSLEETLKSVHSGYEKIKAKYEEAKAELLAKKKVLEETDKKLQKLREKQNQITGFMSENEMKAKQLDHKFQRFNKETSAARASVERMLQEHEWIKAECQFFGKAHTDYDFKAVDPKQTEAQVQKLAHEQQKLEGTINKKVASMISEADRKYQALQEKKSTVERDRSQILKTIEDLDHKKVKALEETYEQVNKDFGNLYSKFLPGATATLTKVNNDILEGLEIRVCFGTVWKESLTELSGGQRSLMALSLILALCRYKSAPLYILDEIDAALDNSHTENIGDIIGKEFSSSQFIVVSLKEGFYRNCNSLFEVELDETLQTSKVHVRQKKSNKKRK